MTKFTILYSITFCILIQINYSIGIFFEIFNQTKTYELFVEGFSNEQVTSPQKR